MQLEEFEAKVKTFVEREAKEYADEVTYEIDSADPDWPTAGVTIKFNYPLEGTWDVQLEPDETGKDLWIPTGEAGGLDADIEGLYTYLFFVAAFDLKKAETENEKIKTAMNEIGQKVDSAICQIVEGCEFESLAVIARRIEKRELQSILDKASVWREETTEVKNGC